MAEAKSELLPFPADALHTDALAKSKDIAFDEVGAGYYGLRQAIIDMGRSCLIPGSRVVDLRCDLSVLMPLIIEHEDMCKFVVLSPTEKESWKCFDRLRTRVRAGFVDTACLDLRERFPEVSTRMILSMQALGDLEVAHRAEVLRSMHRRLEKGGAAIVMEDVADETRAEEWESLMASAGFRTVKRTWSDGIHIAWTLRK